MSMGRTGFGGFLMWCCVRFAERNATLGCVLLFRVANCNVRDWRFAALHLSQSVTYVDWFSGADFAEAACRELQSFRDYFEELYVDDTAS